MGWGRRGIGMVAGLGLLLGLAGCTVPPGGALGLTLDAAGQPMVVVQMCKGHIDGATVYSSDDNPENEQRLGDWKVTPAVTGFSQFSLTKGGNGWQVNQPFAARDAGTTYTIYGWSEDNSWSANHFGFTASDLTKLQLGRVLYSAFDGTESTKTGSVEEFKSDVCKQQW